jgi:hypothetical protein
MAVGASEPTAYWALIAGDHDDTDAKGRVVDVQAATL